MVTHVHPSLSKPALNKSHSPSGEPATRLERMQDLLTAIVVIAAVALLAIVLAWYASLYYGATHRGTAAQASPAAVAAPTATDTSGTDSNASNIVPGATSNTVPGNVSSMQATPPAATVPQTGSTSVNTSTPNAGGPAAGQ